MSQERASIIALQAIPLSTRCQPRMAGFLMRNRKQRKIGRLAPSTKKIQTHAHHDPEETHEAAVNVQASTVLSHGECMRKPNPSRSKSLLINQNDEDDFDPHIDIDIESWHDASALVPQSSRAVPIDYRSALNADGSPSLARWEELCEHAEAVSTPNSKVVFFIMNMSSTRIGLGNRD